MVKALSELEQEKVDLLRDLVQGASTNDVGGAADRRGRESLELAYGALEELDPQLAGRLSPDDRRRVSNYLLKCQSPGQAAGTWELLERSRDARRWALWIRESLADLYGAEPPTLPGIDEGPSPAERARGAQDGGGSGSLLDRRRERQRKRTQAEVRVAAAVMASPFREEAIESHARRQDELKLPHYASRPVRLALYALLACLAAVLLLCVLVKVPTHTSARVLVLDLGAGAPGDLRGPTALALFPADARGLLAGGKKLRVRLPDTEERVSMRIARVERRVLSPREVIERYDVPDPLGKRVNRPAAVALAALRVPEGAPPPQRFEGVVTSDAEARTGSERIIGLVF